MDFYPMCSHDETSALVLWHQHGKKMPWGVAYLPQKWDTWNRSKLGPWSGDRVPRPRQADGCIYQLEINALGCVVQTVEVVCYAAFLWQTLTDTLFHHSHGIYQGCQSLQSWDSHLNVWHRLFHLGKKFWGRKFRINEFPEIFQDSWRSYSLNENYRPDC